MFSNSERLFSFEESYLGSPRREAFYRRMSWVIELTRGLHRSVKSAACADTGKASVFYVPSFFALCLGICSGRCLFSRLSAEMRTSSVRNFVRLALIAVALCLAKWAAPAFSMAPVPMENDMEMSFGKHRGRLISEIAEEDPSYLKWLLGQTEDPDSSSRLLEVAEYVREYFPEVEDAAVVGFGKYKGMSVSQLVKEDPDYCSWILATAAKEDSGNRGFLEVAEWLKELVGPQGPPMRGRPVTPPIRFTRARRSISSESGFGVEAETTGFNGASTCAVNRSSPVSGFSVPFEACGRRLFSRLSAEMRTSPFRSLGRFTLFALALSLAKWAGLTLPSII
eukprot:s6075_g2.t1